MRDAHARPSMNVLTAPAPLVYISLPRSPSLVAVLLVPLAPDDLSPPVALPSRLLLATHTLVLVRIWPIPVPIPLLPSLLTTPLSQRNLVSPATISIPL